MAGGGGGGGPYLDSLATTPRAALAIKKLISTATVAVRVRRSNDDAEQDVGFSGDALDTSALASFVGSNSAYVTKVYDQTGNGFDATQTTKANQPRIVNAGVYDGYIYFNGTSHCLLTGVLPFGTAQAALYSKLSLPGTYSGNPMLFELGEDSIAQGLGSFGCYYESGSWNVHSTSGGTGPSNTRVRFYEPSWSSMVTASFLFDTSIVGAGEISMRVNGSSLSPVNDPFTNEQTGNYRSDKALNIGARNNGSSLGCRMNLFSLAIYDADSSAIATAIEACIG